VIRTYFGCIIEPLRPNSMGLRWGAYCKGSYYRAETLQGLKQMIRHAVTFVPDPIGFEDIAGVIV
jgi:hypothetical protein